MLYRQKNPHGGDTYEKNIRLDFSANVNPLGTPGSVLRAVTDSLSELSKYPDPYCRGLVRAIAKYEGVDEKNILCGLGAAELIYAFCAAARPKRVLEAAPGFLEYSAALGTVGAEITRHILTKDNDFTLTDEFLRVIERGSFDAVFLCTPNNPTGRLIPPDLLEEISLLCHKRGIRLVLDECFLDLADGGLALSMKSRLNARRGLLLLRSFTKSYGIAGLRLGYCLSADDELLDGMSRVSQPWNIPSPTQSAGIAALRETEFIRRTRELIAVEREYLVKELLSLGFYVCPPSANYILFRGGPRLCSELEKRGIQVRDCENYHGLGAGWVRVAVRLHDENTELVSAIRDIKTTGV